MKRNVSALALMIVALAAVGAWTTVFYKKAPTPAINPPSPSPAPSGNAPIATLHYACDANKSIDAVLYDGSSTPAAAPGMPPTPGGSADVSLSDGRSMHLYQTISADGVRYANSDESLVFWTKGSGAFVMAGNARTYTNCTEAANGGRTATTTDSSTAWMKSFKIVTQADNDSMVHLSKNERFLIRLGGGLSWKLVFAPASAIARVSNSTTANGLQGVYEATATGTVTLQATGAPICAPHMMCPEFLVSVKVAFIIGS